MTPYDELIEVLDIFIERFGGATRLRGVKTAALIQSATAQGTGMTVSEIAKATGAPLENVRRHMDKHVELGSLRYVNDPNDERVKRVVAADPDGAGAMMLDVLNRIRDVD